MTLHSGLFFKLQRFPSDDALPISLQNLPVCFWGQKGLQILDGFTLEKVIRHPSHTVHGWIGIDISVLILPQHIEYANADSGAFINALQKSLGLLEFGFEMFAIGDVKHSAKESLNLSLGIFGNFSLGGDPTDATVKPL